MATLPRTLNPYHVPGPQRAQRQLKLPPSSVRPNRDLFGTGEVSESVRRSGKGLLDDMVRWKQAEVKENDNVIALNASYNFSRELNERASEFLMTAGVRKRKDYDAYRFGLGKLKSQYLQSFENGRQQGVFDKLVTGKVINDEATAFRYVLGEEKKETLSKQDLLLQNDFNKISRKLIEYRSQLELRDVPSDSLYELLNSRLVTYINNRATQYPDGVLRNKFIKGANQIALRFESMGKQRVNQLRVTDRARRDKILGDKLMRDYEVANADDVSKFLTSPSGFKSEEETMELSKKINSNFSKFQGTLNEMKFFSPYKREALLQRVKDKNLVWYTQIENKKNRDNGQDAIKTQREDIANRLGSMWQDDEENIVAAETDIREYGDKFNWSPQQVVNEQLSYRLNRRENRIKSFVDAEQFKEAKIYLDKHKKDFEPFAGKMTNLREYIKNREGKIQGAKVQLGEMQSANSMIQSLAIQKGIEPTIDQNLLSIMQEKFHAITESDASFQALRGTDNVTYKRRRRQYAKAIVDRYSTPFERIRMVTNLPTDNEGQKMVKKNILEMSDRDFFIVKNYLIQTGGVKRGLFNSRQFYRTYDVLRKGFVEFYKNRDKVVVEGEKPKTMTEWAIYFLRLKDSEGKK